MVAAAVPDSHIHNLTDAPEARYRVAVEYSVEDDLRYISHHDEIRMFERALIRARWPLSYSQGFNPQPRVVLVLPRNVGMASDCQLACVGLRQPCAADWLAQTLDAELPPRCTLREMVGPLGKQKPHPKRVTYTLPLDEEDREAAAQGVGRVLGRSSVDVLRESGPNKPARTVDIRPMIEKLEVQGGVFTMRLRYIDQRTARPTEIITESGLPHQKYAHRVCRRDVEWDMKLQALASCEPDVQVRNTVGKEIDKGPQESNEKGQENQERAQQKGGC